VFIKLLLGGGIAGSPALTSRGLKEADFAKIAEFLDRSVRIALDIQSKTGKRLADFLAAIPQRADIKVGITNNILSSLIVNDYSTLFTPIHDNNVSSPHEQ
jgi:hypothetical protein